MVDLRALVEVRPVARADGHLVRDHHFLGLRADRVVGEWRPVVRVRRTGDDRRLGAPLALMIGYWPSGACHSVGTGLVEEVEVVDAGPEVEERVTAVVHEIVQVGGTVVPGREHGNRRRAFGADLARRHLHVAVVAQSRRELVLRRRGRVVVDLRHTRCRGRVTGVAGMRRPWLRRAASCRPGHRCTATTGRSARVRRGRLCAAAGSSRCSSRSLRDSSRSDARARPRRSSRCRVRDHADANSGRAPLQHPNSGSCSSQSCPTNRNPGGQRSQVGGERSPVVVRLVHDDRRVRPDRVRIGILRTVAPDVEPTTVGCRRTWSSPPARRRFRFRTETRRPYPSRRRSVVVRRVLVGRVGELTTRREQPA